MKQMITSAVLAIALGITGPASVQAAHAHGASEASALSVALPIAVVVSSGAASSVAVAALPVALSVTGSTLVVKSVEASARGVVCVFERASDGARVSVEIVGRSAANIGVVAGATVSVTVIASGALISAAGEAIAFFPNALGRALSHHERM